MTRPQRPEETRWRAVHAMGDRNPPIVLHRSRAVSGFERPTADCKHRVMS